MCGIAGLLTPLDADRAQVLLNRMLRAQVHRGPDDEGAQVSLLPSGYALGLGNRRLAIIDLSPAGHQPMRNPETGDVLVYNGELYNAPELRASLTAEGFGFAGHSDTEVLLRAYQRWGTGCLDRLRGMFAFAVWDAGGGRLVLARDHLGIKPLYYCARPGLGFIFASEVRALLATGEVPRDIDRRAVAGYLAYGAVQEPQTILQHVSMLPSGTWLETDPFGRRVQRATYWTPPFPDPQRRIPNDSDTVAEGRALLERAVGRHLLSDVPVGIFLSSGLDSTAVLGLAQGIAGADVHAFTVSFPDQPAYDEGPAVQRTAARLGAVLHERPVGAEEAAVWATDALEAMDQPSMDGLNTYVVSRAVRDLGLRVALSGQGGDEVFGGYGSFSAAARWARWMRRVAALPATVRVQLATLAAVKQGTVRREKARDLARTGPDLAGCYFQFRRLVSDDGLQRLGIEPTSVGLSAFWQPPDTNVHADVVLDDPMLTVGRLEMAYYLRNMLLRDGDVFGMANSLEIRVPFLDRDLVEWASRLPGHVRLPQGVPNKYLLRRMCSDFYAADQLQHPKRGFTLPLSRWLQGPLRELMEENLLHVKRTGILRAAGIDDLRTTYLRESGTAAWSRLWALVVLGAWLRRHAAVPAPASLAA